MKHFSLINIQKCVIHVFLISSMTYRNTACYLKVFQQTPQVSGSADIVCTGSLSAALGNMYKSLRPSKRKVFMTAEQSWQNSLSLDITGRHVKNWPIVEPRHGNNRIPFCCLLAAYWLIIWSVFILRQYKVYIRWTECSGSQSQCVNIFPLSFQEMR